MMLLEVFFVLDGNNLFHSYETAGLLGLGVTVPGWNSVQIMELEFPKEKETNQLKYVHH